MDEPMPFGPMDDFIIIDEFTLDEVKGSQCDAVLLKHIKKFLNRNAVDKDFKYLGICLPCYNEELFELIKTLLSLLDNMEFMKKVRMHDDLIGNALKDEFRTLVPVIVPIFDGVKALSPSMRTWLDENFPGIFDTFFDDELPNSQLFNSEHKMQEDIEGSKPEVRAVCRKWWYTYNEHAPSDIANTTEAEEVKDAMEQSFEFFMMPIIKRKNHRKHNSHLWFFKSFCSSLDDSMDYTFLTDCGTTYKRNALATMMKELFFKPDLIAVTARQRVELPNKFFHPCESASFKWMEGNHAKTGPNPCWKCWLTFFASPICLQGFEYEFSQIMSYTMFNICETLPVMPGPCQMLDWQKVRNYKVIDDYFDLLMKGEAVSRLPKTLPRNYLRMNMEGTPTEKENLLLGPGIPAADSTDSSSSFTTHALKEFKQVNGSQDKMTPKTPSSSAHTPSMDDGLTFVEFVRVNMRLAEDRILSFTTVFSTGFGTKWVPKATFYYTPEVRWDTLLLQRRRWTNGTFAAFLFYFSSKRARGRVDEGMFDDHKWGRSQNFVDLLWCLQLFQSAQVLISPALFGALSYIGLEYTYEYFPNTFFFAGQRWYPHIYGGISGSIIWVSVFMITYVVWALQSYYSPKGRMSELQCYLMAILGFLFIVPFYIGTLYVIIWKGINSIQVLYLFTIFFPPCVAVFQEPLSVVYYLAMTPWFCSLIVFFLVYMPHYSFSRLWDTTWGNRATGVDSALTNAGVKVMRRWNFYFMIGLISTNVILCWCLIRLIELGYNYKFGFVLFVTFPTIIELMLAASVVLIVVPLRTFRFRSYIPIRAYDRNIPDELSTVGGGSQYSRQSGVHNRLVGPIIGRSFNFAPRDGDPASNPMSSMLRAYPNDQHSYPSTSVAQSLVGDEEYASKSSDGRQWKNFNELKGDLSDGETFFGKLPPSKSTAKFGIDSHDDGDCTQLKNEYDADLSDVECEVMDGVDVVGGLGGGGDSSSVKIAPSLSSSHFGKMISSSHFGDGEGSGQGTPPSKDGGVSAGVGVSVGAGVSVGNNNSDSTYEAVMLSQASKTSSSNHSLYDSIGSDPTTEVSSVDIWEHGYLDGDKIRGEGQGQGQYMYARDHDNEYSVEAIPSQVGSKVYAIEGTQLSERYRQLTLQALQGGTSLGSSTSPLLGESIPSSVMDVPSIPSIGPSTPEFGLLAMVDEE